MNEPRRIAPTAGRLYGVGVGPGDPELITIKAQRIVRSCPVVVHFAARGRRGNAWSIVEALVAPDQRVLRMDYPVTTEAVTKAEYERVIDDFYDVASETIAEQLTHGHDVAVLCEGDPLFYGSYMYVHHRLATRFDSTVVPGVTSFSAASAAAGVPLVSLNEVLTVLPGVMPVDDLKAALVDVDAAVIIKVGRHLGDIRSAVDAAGLGEDAIYVERASWPDQRVLLLSEAADVRAPYFSLVLIPGRGLRDRSPTRR